MAKLFLLLLLAVGSCFNFSSPKARLTRDGKRESAETLSRSEVLGGVFNVLRFGAAGNGKTDDTHAFLAAWTAACMVERSTLLIPSGHVFLIGPVIFSGENCKPGITFKLDGTITASTSPWRPRRQQWLKFTNLKGVKVNGRGIIDGQGSAWWGKKSAKSPGGKPTALRFYGSQGIVVSGITIRNSAQCHLKFDGCDGISVFSVTVSSPSFTAHTDGIHLQNSKHVAIRDVVLGCGDDCVSIQTGCSNVEIRNVTCGPGHGISIGGLGEDESEATVSNVRVKNVKLNGTLTGVRIKTWQGGYGYVRNVSFSDISVNQVGTPVMIDQYYCDGGGHCRNRSAAVALTGISYENVVGTFTRVPVLLACSDRVPCSGIVLKNVQLRPAARRRGDGRPFCWKARGLTIGTIVPPIGCLKR